MSCEATQVLLCRPEHYQIRYSINPWMTGQRVDPGRAAYQFEALVEAYRRLRLRITILEPDPDLPDMVFTANAGLLIGETFVPSNFRYRERFPESALFAAFFASQGKRIAPLDPTIIFEGAGDALFLADRLILGYGFRSSRSVAGAMRTHLSQDLIVSVGLSNPYYYHLDTCFSPLPSGRFIYYPDAFDDRSRKLLESMGGYWVTERFCTRYGCNMVAIGDTMITSYADDRLREVARLERMRIELLDVTEFIKAGGGVRCLSLLY